MKAETREKMKLKFRCSLHGSKRECLREITMQTLRIRWKKVSNVFTPSSVRLLGEFRRVRLELRGINGVQRSFAIPNFWYFGCPICFRPVWLNGTHGDHFRDNISFHWYCIVERKFFSFQWKQRRQVSSKFFCTLFSSTNSVLTLIYMYE